MTDSLDDPFALASLRETAGNEAVEQRRKKLTACFATAEVKVQAATWQVTAIPLKIIPTRNPNLNTTHCNVPIASHAHVLYSAVSFFRPRQALASQMPEPSG